MQFYKYSGSGNDFIMLDNRKGDLELNSEAIAKWCDRRYGIGADGVILIGASEQQDFSMGIFNSDGSEAEMCGNGARCSIHYFHHVLTSGSGNSYSFQTMNGRYEGSIQDGNQVRIKMTELYDLERYDVKDLSGKNALYLNTGVPHTVIQVSHIKDVNVQAVGSAIRHDERFDGGSNVCFFDINKEEQQAVRLRVYERGVEGETLCCGTGVMATAIACSKFFGWFGEVQVEAQGGELIAIVDKELKDLHFQGEVFQVFKGQLLG